MNVATQEDLLDKAEVAIYAYLWAFGSEDIEDVVSAFTEEVVNYLIDATEDITGPFT